MPIIRRIVSAIKPREDRFPRLLSFYRAIRDQLDVRNPAIETPWGFRLAGNKIMASGSFEPRETAHVREILKQHDLLVNVGANVGYYCCHALSMGKPVIAFEPLRRNLHYLCENVKNNGWENAEIYPLALYNRSGVMEIYGSDTGASVVKGWAGIPAGYRDLVPCATMDSVISGRLRGKRALIIIDVEGAENWILEGAPGVLSSEPRPTWLLEICFKEHHPGGLNRNFEKTFEFFWKNGYRSFSVDAGMRPVTAADVRRWAQTGTREFGYVTYQFSAES